MDNNTSSTLRIAYNQPVSMASIGANDIYSPDQLKGQSSCRIGLHSGSTENEQSLRSIYARLLELHNPLPPSSLSADAITSIAKKKPLDEELFDATANAKILTSQVAMHLDKAWRKRLFQQIDSLHDPEEWDPDDKPVQKGSFATFLKAVCQIKPTIRPGLGLSNAGHLVAAWTVGKDRLTIEFMEKDRVRWVISRYVDGELEQFAAQTQVTRLMDTLLPYFPQKWLTAH